MKQQSFFKAHSKAHGGSHSINKRRSKRVLSTKQALHVTLRSEFAKNSRSLLKHKKHIDFVLQKAARLFNIRVYEKAICGNHLHLLILGKNRAQIQNFFRVVAGHIAQEILRQFPITKSEQDRLVEKAGGALKTVKNRRAARKIKENSGSY